MKYHPDRYLRARPFVIDPLAIHKLNVWREEFRDDFAEEARKLRRRRGEEKRKLTEFFSLSILGVGWLVPDCAHRATTALSWGLSEQRELTSLPRLLLRLQQLLPLLEHPIDRLRGAGVQTEAAAFKTA